MSNLTFSHPVPCEISQHFGENPALYARWGYPGHNGLDYACAEGKRVHATRSGSVDKIGVEPDGYGVYVRIDHGEVASLGKIWSYYCHLGQVLCKTGDYVQSGQVIAASGNTGFSTGPHLHFGLRLQGGNVSQTVSGAYKGYIDPLPLIRDGIPEDQSHPGVVETEGLRSMPAFPQLPLAKSIAKPFLYLRSAPERSSPVVGRLLPGMQFSVLGYKPNGEEIWLRLGHNQWAAMRYRGHMYIEWIRN